MPNGLRSIEAGGTGAASASVFEAPLYFLIPRELHKRFVGPNGRLVAAICFLSKFPPHELIKLIAQVLSFLPPPLFLQSSSMKL